MRIAALALILAIGGPLAGGQHATPKTRDWFAANAPKTAQQAATPSAVPPKAKSGGGIDLSAGFVPKRGNKLQRRPQVSLSPDAFERLFSSGDPWAVVARRPTSSSTDTRKAPSPPLPAGYENYKPVTQVSLKLCKTWISAAVALSDEAFEQVDVSLYEDVPERLHSCVTDYPTLTAFDLRKAARAIYRFDQADENLFAVSNAEKRKQLTAQQADLDSAKASLAEVVSKYNALVSEYNQLNEANGQLFRTAQTLKLSVQQAQLDCASATSQAYLNGASAARQLDRYTPPPQPTVCRTELVGWTLVTKCQ